MLRKVKRRIWSFILGVGLFFIGVHFFRSVFLAKTGYDWELDRILELAAGICLPLIGIVVSLPEIISRAGVSEKLEILSRYLIQASMWCFLSLLIMEITLRILILNPPLRRDVTNWAGDIPGMHFMVLWGKEGYAITHYEKWGEIRTPYHDNNRNNNVIVLGDSHTEALQVGDNLKFVSVAETLVRQDGYSLDLHNLGRSGLAMADYVSWIPAYQSIYHPKVIVVQLTTGDFIESFHEGQFNHFILKDDNTLGLMQTYDLSSGFVQKARRKYEFFPQIINLGYQRWDLIFGSLGKTPIENTNPTADVNNTVVNASKKAGGNTPDKTMNPEVFTSELAKQQMDMLIEASDGTPLIVVLLPYTPYVSGDGIQMKDAAHEQLKEFFKQYYPGIAVVDPLPEFQKLASTGHLPRGFFNSLPGEGHLNMYGHEIVGTLLAKTIEQVLR